MAKLNTRTKRATVRTAEGAPARIGTKGQQLARILNACMLWEDNFYVDGKSIAKLIAEQVAANDPMVVQTLATKARNEQKLRHAPLLVVREMARGPLPMRLLVADTLVEVIKRPDELAEFLKMYWTEVEVKKPLYSWLEPEKKVSVKKQPIAAQVKKGLARAFQNFDEYALAKYNRDGDIKLRDVLFLVHAKPKSPAQADVWKRLAENKLETPDTWEVALSGGADKKETFSRLIAENKLGALALLRNLRNMIQAGVNDSLIREALLSANVERVLPFRFIASAKYGPRFEPELEKSMFKCLEGHDKLDGKTVLVVDASGSMNDRISGKSEMTRYDAACALAMLLREICDEVAIYTFNYNAKGVAPRRGFALRDAMGHASGGTNLGQALATTSRMEPDADRVIVITDEQSHDAVGNPFAKAGAKAYMVNVACNQYGVGYGNGWSHIDGWSEAIVDYILAEEAEDED